jgi:hypothetical protein
MIVAAGSVSSFFHGVVEDAIKAKRVEATNGATSYLVSLLSDYARPGNRAEEALGRPMAFLLDEAIHTPAPAERFERLRTLGDGVLYSCGFFGDHFEARGVDRGYLIGIGSVAYANASSMLRLPSAPTSASGEEPLDVYRELADKFASFVSVIIEIADAIIAQGMGGSRDLVKVYERWLRTGSERLASALTSHGLMPTRGLKGMLQ